MAADTLPSAAEASAAFSASVGSCGFTTVDWADSAPVVVIADGDNCRMLADLRTIIANGRQRAATAINEALVATYWSLGERIVQEEQNGRTRAGYGEQLLHHLGRVLSQEFGRGFAEQSLRNMRQFYLTYPIRSALRSELSWTHYRTLMRLPTPEQREFYVQVAATGRWSSRDLDKQIQSMLYERAAHSRRPELLAPSLPAVPVGALTYDTAFKDPYILDFLGLADTYSEKDIVLLLGVPGGNPGHDAVVDALSDLLKPGLLDANRRQQPWRYKVTSLGLHPADSWADICKIDLTEDEGKFLTKVVELGQDPHEGFTCVLEVKSEQVYEALGWPWKGLGCDSTILKALEGKGVIRLRRHAQAGAIPTYRGIVRATCCIGSVL